MRDPHVELVHPKIDAYLGQFSSHDDEVLRVMEQQAEREDFPIVGPQVGRLLMSLAKAIGARRIFEMGSGFGYSGLWFAKALLPGGRLTLTDTSMERLNEAKAYFKQAGYERKLECLAGDAIELIAKARGPFDAIFLDADKARYPLAFQTAWPKLRLGGLFIADNVLWFGRVLNRHPDEDTQGILGFTRLLFETPGALSNIIPLRDGVSLSLKIH